MCGFFDICDSALDGAVMHMDVDQSLLAAKTGDQKTAFRAYRDKTGPTFTGD